MWDLGVDVCGFCGRQFGLPVRLTNLSEGLKDTYSACPFCLTRVKKDGTERAVEPVVSKKLKRSRSSENTEEAARAGVEGCGHHLGYLKGRAKNAAIPDECLTCPRILECMT